MADVKGKYITMACTLLETKPQAKEAALLKSRHKMSYADAFAAALAKARKAELVTGDPEFRTIGEYVKVRWLE